MKIYEVHAYEGNARANWLCTNKKQAFNFIKELESEDTWSEIWLRTWSPAKGTPTMRIEENRYISGKPF